MNDRLNILVIMADQLTPFALSAYGNSVCRTPNLDRLASEGLVFENAYCNNPLCVPSRTSMLSGLLSPRIDAFDNASELSSSVPTVAHYLRSAGYWTVLSGKMHFIGPDQLHGFNERLTTDVYPANFHWIADWNAGPGFVPSGTALNGVVEAGPAIRTLQEDFDDETAFRTISKLYELARSPDQRPFFQITSFTSPHTPFTVSQEYWNLYQDDAIDLPAVGEIPFGEMDYHSKSLFFTHGRHRHNVTRDHIRNARRAYYGMISYIDNKIGEILDVLERTGLRDNTAIFFIADHGEMMGERGMWFKQCFWESSARIPLVASIPGAPANRRIGSVVSLVDMLPTWLELSGDTTCTVNAELDGTSLVPMLWCQHGQSNDIAICDYYGVGPCVPTRMVRRGPLKYIYTHGYPELLFDLAADRNELSNLAGSGDLHEQQTELKRICMQNWNPDELCDRIILSQRQRRLIASTPGEHPSWDYVARLGDEARFVRADGVDRTKSRMRLPFKEPVPPDWPELDAGTIEKIIAGEAEFDPF